MMRFPLPSPSSRLTGFGKNRSGVAALEFALILPAMLLLLIGGVEISNGVSIKRKVSHAASAISDLVAGDTTIASVTEMNDIFKAGAAVITPYSTTLLKASVVAITVDANKKATVSWAQALNGGACPAKGTAVTVPANLLTANTSMVMVETSYAYTPTMGYAITGTLNLKDKLFQLTRSGKAIAGPACS